MTRPIVTKSVNDKFAIGLQYQAPDLEVGQTILNAEASVSPLGLELIGDVNIEGSIVSQLIAGGVAGKDYSVLFKIATSAGYVYNSPGKDSILVRVIF